MYEVKLGKIGQKRKKYIGKSITYEEAWKIMINAIKELFSNYPKVYRTWMSDDNKTQIIDFGCHSKYFYIIKK